MFDLTWGEFKKIVEAQNVQDSTRIEIIDTGMYPDVKEIQVYVKATKNGNEVAIMR
ncbi:MAG: hypothetical protein Q7R33_01025 [Nitrosarchaeum sp.]|nr:hypothetical protein [Nitrosarchaeum sp.]